MQTASLNKRTNNSATDTSHSYSRTYGPRATSTERFCQTRSRGGSSAQWFEDGRKRCRRYTDRITVTEIKRVRFVGEPRYGPVERLKRESSGMYLMEGSERLAWRCNYGTMHSYK
jgi:hypothetical protein